MTEYKIEVLTSNNWSALEELFGEKGACGGCWCMYWRLKAKEWNEMKGEGNKEAMKKIVESGETAGLLAFMDEVPVGWCAIAAREKFIRLENSRILKPIDSQPVWSITCLFIDKHHRRKGLSRVLINASIQFAREQGAKIIEAYPVEPNKDLPDVFAYTGIASAFSSCGFKECLRRSPTRPIMRYLL